MQVQNHRGHVEPADGVFGCPMRRRDDVYLSSLMDSYGTHGGLSSHDEVVGAMRSYWRQPVSILARWIVDRRIVSFVWKSQILLPLFQFARPRMAPHQGVVDACTELNDVMDDEGLAGWFIQPNACLESAAPADRAVAEPEAVIEAARRARLDLVSRRRVIHAVDSAYA